MSWIKVRDINNNTFVIPESVFKNSYEKCGVFKKVEISNEPIKSKTIKREVEDYDTKIQLTEQTEINTSRKSSKKA